MFFSSLQRPLQRPRLWVARGRIVGLCGPKSNFVEVNFGKIFFGLQNFAVCKLFCKNLPRMGAEAPRPRKENGLKKASIEQLAKHAHGSALAPRKRSKAQTRTENINRKTHTKSVKKGLVL